MTTPAKRTTGRPRIFSEELAQTICERIANGESLRQVCQDENLPCRETVYSWIRSNSEFLDQYAQAKEWQRDLLLDEIIELADKATPTAQGVQLAKLRIDVRKWLISRLEPKKYGKQATPSSLQAAPSSLTDLFSGDT